MNKMFYGDWNSKKQKTHNCNSPCWCFLQSSLINFVCHVVVFSSIVAARMKEKKVEMMRGIGKIVVVQCRKRRMLCLMKMLWRWKKLKGCRNNVWDKLVGVYINDTIWENRTRHNTLDTFKAVLVKEREQKGDAELRLWLVNILL